jgi:hypothetical protein
MERTFLYHALASGVSGKITSPFQDLIEVQAASALPPTGGYSASRVENFRYKEILSFRSTTTLTIGSFSESKRKYSTLAITTIEGLNILGAITADRIVARLASTQPEEGGAPEFTIVGSHFENLQVAGYPLDVRPDLKRLAGYSRPKRVDLRSLIIPPELEEDCGLKPLEDGAIEVPQLGKLYLMEFLSTPCYQSLTMLHLDLGCPVESGGSQTGGVACAHASSNGEFYPP